MVNADLFTGMDDYFSWKVDLKFEATDDLVDELSRRVLEERHVSNQVTTTVHRYLLRNNDVTTTHLT